jgi:hydroxypyruvate isomerase
MIRRDFLLGGAALSTAAATLTSATGLAQDKPARSHEPFRLKYAPHFNMFKNSAGDDLVDQVKFMYDQGFTAMEDNGMKGRSIEDQERVAKEMTRLGMTMGVFVATGTMTDVTFAGNVNAPGKRGEEAKAAREKFLQDMRDAVEVAKRVNAKWCTVVPGHVDDTQEWDYQTANVIDNLKRCCEICEPTGLVMVLEPLNWWSNHPGLFLSKIPQAYQICKAVGSPSCKILDDLYHQQITEGNLIPNIDLAWDEIAYFQTGDNPGRKEPTTGEINYQNVFKHIHAKGFQGVIGMEHGNSKPGKEGEQAVIDAYRYCDSF